MSDRFLVYLRLSSYTQIGSVGAEHWYGKLVLDSHDKRREHELRRALTAQDARYLTKKDGCSALTAYRKGQMTERFDSRQDVIDTAIAEWKTHFPEGYALVQGSTGICEPQPILDGPALYTRRVNALAKRAESIGYWEMKPREMERICALWNEINRKANVKN